MARLQARSDLFYAVIFLVEFCFQGSVSLLGDCMLKNPHPALEVLNLRGIKISDDESLKFGLGLAGYKVCRGKEYLFEGIIFACLCVDLCILSVVFGFCF